jgi:hypothetical protein
MLVDGGYFDGVVLLLDGKLLIRLRAHRGMG